MAPRWGQGSQVFVNVASVASKGPKNGTLAVAAVVKEAKGNGWYVVKRSEDGVEFTCRSSAFTNAPSSSHFQSSGSTAKMEETLSLQDDSSNGTADISSDFVQSEIIDLDGSIEKHFFPTGTSTSQTPPTDFLWQAAHHSQFTRWVVFTDLHVALSTLPTCLAVLKLVHEVAVQRQAGVLFLGDFWHHRVTLRVDCLNAILGALKNWTVPLVMIPGNHDQLTLGGQSHSLTPLENAYRLPVNDAFSSRAWATAWGKNHEETIPPSSLPGPLILDRPTKFMNALFIPHIRDGSCMETILKSPCCRSEKDEDRVNAIFCHVDVSGAYMNDGMQSQAGFSSCLWPGRIPVFTGHFHKPHNVTHPHDGGIHIEYVGSPYQVTLSEADQTKSLTILERKNDSWSVTERVPIDVGRKHFRRTPAEFLKLRLIQSDSNKNESPPSFLRKGDRVIVALHSCESLQSESLSEFNTYAEVLRKAGVQVEIRQEDRVSGDGDSFAPEPTVPQIPEMSIQSTWQLYLAEQVRRESIPKETADYLRETGLQVLREDLNIDVDALVSQPRTSQTLEFESVTLEGYGPFEKKITYPLWKRGLVLLRGQNKGDILQSDESSNGSGKSTLAMATLWGLTGSIDPRPVGDLKVADMINEGVSFGRVTVQGRKIVAGRPVPFAVTRSKSSSKSDLSFLWDGRDESRQTPTETQAAVAEVLGIASPEILGRTIFHGQFGHDELLKATGSKFKEELSLVVSPLTVWQDAAKAARKNQKEAEKRADVLEGMISMKEKELECLHKALQKAKADLADAEDNLLSHISQENTETEILDTHDAFEVDLESRLSSLTSEIDEAEKLQKQQASKRDDQLTELQTDVDLKMKAHAKLAKSLQASQLELNTLELQQKVAEDNAQKILEKWGSIDRAKFENCPTCGQTLGEHMGVSLASSAKLEKVGILDDIEMIAEALLLEKKEYERIETELEFATCSLEAAKTTFQDHFKEWNNHIQAMDVQMSRLRSEKDSVYSLQRSQLDREIRDTTHREKQKAALDAKYRAVELAKSLVANVQQQRGACSLTCEELKTQKICKITTRNRMKELAEAFGQRGVQSFVFRNSLESLQSLSQSYLSKMSDGNQRLELALDDGDRIIKRAYVRSTVSGNFASRSLASLSGGQLRRCALAMQLGFAELLAQRGVMRSSLLVMDEPLTHLDRAGRAKVGSLLRGLLEESKSFHLQTSTILLILQDLAAEDLEEAFDAIDVVVKAEGCSTVHVDGKFSN